MRSQITTGVRKQIGDRIRTAYMRCNFSRAEFARAVGVQYSTLWRYERGQIRPSSKVVQRMGELTGFEERWILCQEPVA